MSQSSYPPARAVAGRVLAHLSHQAEMARGRGETDLATAPDVNAALVRAGVAVSALVPEEDSLEDVFVSLVRGADAPR